MKNIFYWFYILFLCLTFGVPEACAEESHSENKPMLFLFPGGNQHLEKYQSLLRNPCIAGVQIVYTWRALEPQKNHYDFSVIKNNLDYLNKLHKKLFIQLQDRTFSPARIPVPDYILQEKIYHGGMAMQYDRPGENLPIATGWVARVWDPAVRERFQLLIKNIASHFDGEIYGINLPETAIDIDAQHRPSGFTPEKYFSGELDNLDAAHQFFKKSIVVQYVNFFPGEWNNDHGYMGKLFSYALQNNIGLGGPDVVPFKKSQMNNSYKFFHVNKIAKNKVSLIAMAVQSGDYTYKKPGGSFYEFRDFYNFATNYLGASIIFWNTDEPFFSEKILANLNSQYFQCFSM